MMMRNWSNSQAYGEAWYWDQRYSQEAAEGGGGPFDWYQKYQSLAPLLRLYFPPQSHPRVLVVGCGNSAFSQGMVNDGYSQVFNIDISSVAIEAMQKKHSNCPQLKFMKMDARDMATFEAGFFDAIVDKGTLDSILCGNNSRENAAKMLKEVGRVLEDGGIYLLVTYGAPIYRLPLLRISCSWTIKLHVIDKFLSEDISEHRAWDLTCPVPLDADGVSAEAALGKSPDVHYIYVCIKGEFVGKNKRSESTS